MRILFILMFFGCSILGCAHQKGPYDGQLLEVEPQLVNGCVMIGLISENADAGNPFPLVATNKMIHRVKERALSLGATHLVWRHKTKLAAAAEAYRCTSP